MLWLGAVIVVAQAGGAPAAPDRAQPRPHAREECVAVIAASPQRRSERPQANPSFSATRILDVEFRTLLRRRLEGPHTLQLKLYTPRGHLYQVLAVPFSEKPGKRLLEGFPQPVDEQAATAVRFEGVRRYQVKATLPVAGTSIMTSSLYGEWKAVPHLDDDPDPCGKPRTFVITQ